MSEPISSKPLTDLAFSSLNLEEKLQQGLDQAGFTHCTPIQAGTLPIALEGKDVAGQAQTGTGKTAAFLLAIYQRLLKSPGKKEYGGQPRALIIAPTRELALQIHKDAMLLGGESGLRVALAYGGIDYNKQRKSIEAGVDILIGTPGRMIDYFKQRVFHLRGIETVVLDEADRMFDLGFIKDIRYLLRRMPPVDKRQSLMFSATLSHRVMELAYEHMNNPELVKIETDQVTADNVIQSIYYPANHEKLPLLVGLLRTIKDGRVMVFTNTRVAADRVKNTLIANDLPAAVISGGVPQKKRQTLLRRFHDGELPVLVATDVAARGLHIPDVTHVFNYDLPQDAADYVHRIGRTARLGAKGEAISFACEDYAFHLPDIESYIGYPIPMENTHGDIMPEIKPAPRKPPSKKGRPHGRRPQRHRGGQNQKNGGGGDAPKRRRRKSKQSGGNQP